MAVAAVVGVCVGCCESGVGAGGATEKRADYPLGAAVKIEVDEAWIYWLGPSGGSLYGLEK